jgi:hypothetical protein
MLTQILAPLYTHFDLILKINRHDHISLLLSPGESDGSVSCATGAVGKKKLKGIGRKNFLRFSFRFSSRNDQIKTETPSIIPFFLSDPHALLSFFLIAFETEKFHPLITLLASDAFVIVSASSI